jgi:hypothetical protein
MSIDLATAEATVNLARTRLSVGLTAAGVDVAALPPGFLTNLINLLLSLVSGGCPPTPTPKPPAVAGQEITDALASYPGYCELVAMRMARRDGMLHPLAVAAACVSAGKGSSAPELTNFAEVAAMA